MRKFCSCLCSVVLLGAMAGLAQANDGDVASDPRAFNTFYAPAYRLPDAAAMSSSAASGKGLIHSTYKYLGAESGIREPADEGLVAYFEFLGTGLQSGYSYKQVAGQEYPKMAFLARAANSRSRTCSRPHAMRAASPDPTGTRGNLIHRA